jgi:hypothetical protein
VTEILTEPVSAPNVWRRDDLADAGGWVIRFTEEDLADFERALAHVSKKHLTGVTEIRAEDFPLPHFHERIDDIVDRWNTVQGSLCCAGCPSTKGSARTSHHYLLGHRPTHGEPRAAKPQRRPARPYTRPRQARPVRAGVRNQRKPGVPYRLHRLRGLMCLCPALYGGESFVASSGLLYNFVVDTIRCRSGRRALTWAIVRTGGSSRSCDASVSHRVRYLTLVNLEPRRRRRPRRLRSAQAAACASRTFCG